MRLIVVSNRLPVVLTRRGDGSWESRPGTGGLVTALRPVLRVRRGVWIGWLGSDLGDSPERRAAHEPATREIGYELVPVDIPAEDHDLFYRGFANETIWPLFHDLPSLCRFDPTYFQAADPPGRRVVLGLLRVAQRSLRRQPRVPPRVDIVAEPGTPVRAAADGLVTVAGRQAGYGKVVHLSHGSGLSTRYGHLSEILVRPGQRVKQGDVVGKVGSTGRSTGPHLHYEVHLNGKPVNPLGYVLNAF